MDTILFLILTAAIAFAAIQYEKHLSTRHDWEPYPDTDNEIDYSGDEAEILCCQS